MITESEVRAIAAEEIDAFCAGLGLSRDDYRGYVTREACNPGMYLVFWEPIKPDDSGKFFCRVTGVHTSESESVLRERIKQVFAEDPKSHDMFEPCEIVIR